MVQLVVETLTETVFSSSLRATTQVPSSGESICTEGGPRSGLESDSEESEQAGMAKHRQETKAVTSEREKRGSMGEAIVRWRCDCHAKLRVVSL